MKRQATSSASTTAGLFELASSFLKSIAPAALTKNHKTNLTLSDPSKADWALLGQNKTVVLHPEVTEGPYCE